jgi:hypothetical protein
VGNSKSQVPNHKTNRIWNLIFLKGYVKELLWLKVKQIRTFCQGFVRGGDVDSPKSGIFPLLWSTELQLQLPVGSILSAKIHEYNNDKFEEWVLPKI